MRRLILVFYLLVLTSVAHGQIKVGFITDLEESPQTQYILEALIREIDKTTGINQPVGSSDDMQYFDVISVSDAQNIYQSMDADLVVTLGGLSTKAVSSIASLTTPVIGLGVIDHFIQGIPFEDGKSGKKNFTYVFTSRDIIQEIESFQKLVGFQKLTFLIDPAINKSINQLTGQVLIDSIQKELAVQIEVIQAVENVNSVIQDIETAEAVYLSPLISRNQQYVTDISNYLIKEKIPSLSASKQHVDYGILASSSGDNSGQQIFRRIGIVAADILSGRNAAEIPVSLNTSENFYLNIETARQMDFSPPFEVILTANLVGESYPDGKVYSFAEIADVALEQNLDLKISYKDIDVAALDVRSSRSNALPALTSGLTGSQINEERANALVNSPERSLNLDLTLSQVIYSEEVLASIRIGQYLKSAQEYQTEADVLLVLLETYLGYLDVLSAKTNLAIQRENLDNTRTNLELAKIRVDLGSSNNSDLYRWESELANATQSLIEAQAGLISLKLQLNNLLANSLDDEFEVKDIGIEDELYTSFKNGPLSGLIKTPRDLKIASDFLVEESINNNPNKKQLLENIKATERQLELNKRLLYVPTIALQAQATEVLARGGEGSEEPDMAIPGFNSEIENTSWFVGASLTYPVFTGNSRRVNRQRSQVQLDQLNFSNTSLEQSLDLSIRASTVSLLSATTNLEYSAISAESATQNFELVQNNYKAGKVNITQVIDAQQAALSAQLGAALAVYEYIAANLQIEFGLGFFSMFSTENELDEFQNRFLEYVSDN
jgi:outer membrane protein TolC/ABC-type uncharacterized transport system substrate-binding protein